MDKKQNNLFRPNGKRGKLTVDKKTEFHYVMAAFFANIASFLCMVVAFALLFQNFNITGLCYFVFVWFCHNYLSRHADKLTLFVMTNRGE